MKLPGPLSDVSDRPSPGSPPHRPRARSLEGRWQESKPTDLGDITIRYETVHYGMTRSVFRESIHPKLPVLARQNVQSPLWEINRTSSPIGRLSTERALTAGPYLRSAAESMTKARFASFDPEPIQIETAAPHKKMNKPKMQRRRQNTMNRPCLRQAGKREKANIQKAIDVMSGK